MESLFFDDNFTAVLFFEEGKSSINGIINDIKRIFQPTEIVSSKLDLNTFDFNDFDFDQPFENDDMIRKVIFNKGEDQQLTLEYFQNQFLLEHLIRKDAGYDSEVIKYFFNSYDSNSVLILGFELSLDISNFSESLDNLKNDKSLYPIRVIKKATDGKLDKETFLNVPSNWSTERINFYNKYFEA